VFTQYVNIGALRTVCHSASLLYHHCMSLYTWLQPALLCLTSDTIISDTDLLHIIYLLTYWGIIADCVVGSGWAVSTDAADGRDVSWDNRGWVEGNRSFPPQHYSALSTDTWRQEPLADSSHVCSLLCFTVADGSR